MTPKQAARALEALDRAMDRLVLFTEDHTYPRYHVDDGLLRAPTHWESEALFRLRGMLMQLRDQDR